MVVSKSGSSNRQRIIEKVRALGVDRPAVAAESEAIAEAALKLIKVEYKILDVLMQ